MVNIKINNNSFGYKEFQAIIDDKILVITFMNNLDLYWNCFTKKNDNKCILEITKENYFLFQNFQELFINMTKIKNSLKYLDDNLLEVFSGNTIKWYSDDFPKDEASILTIKKENDKFIVIFNKSNSKLENNTFSIRFNNNGSRYKPYNVAFGIMYNNLINYNYQMHIEEYLYKNKVRTKK